MRWIEKFVHVFCSCIFTLFTSPLVYGIIYLPELKAAAVIKTLFALIARQHTVVCTFRRKLRSSKKICTKRRIWNCSTTLDLGHCAKGIYWLEKLGIFVKPILLEQFVDYRRDHSPSSCFAFNVGWGVKRRMALVSRPEERNEKSIEALNMYHGRYCVCNSLILSSQCMKWRIW